MELNVNKDALKDRVRKQDAERMSANTRQFVDPIAASLFAKQIEYFMPHNEFALADIESEVKTHLLKVPIGYAIID